jgi:outer membrane protein
MKKTMMVSLWLAGLLTQLHAADLIDIYQQAVDSDPAFKAAYSTYMSQTEQLPQARAALLPQVGINAYTAINKLNISSGSFQILEGYNSQQWKLTASQDIFNYKNWSQMQQARASVKAAFANFNDAAQALILRTASAYFNVLFARDNLNYALAKKRANKRQLDQATQRFNVGLEPITSVYDAQSAYDQSTAEVIAAQNAEMNQNENLRKLTNHAYDSIASLRDSKIPLISPEPNSKEEWVATGLRQNYKFLASKYAMQASRENIKAKNAGNWPVFSIQGTTTTTRNNNVGVSSTSAIDQLGSSFFVPTSQQASNVAINVNFPFFQGGITESQARQAKYEYQTSTEQMEQAYREVVSNTYIAFNTIVDGISKIKADKQSLLSQQNTVRSTEAQFLAGTRTMVDVVLAQQHLYEAQDQLAKDQYDYINAVLNLKYLSGTLNVSDLQEINSWLTTVKAN